jgi:alpha-tubulin suppressor-like RCC1 family protein
MGNGTNLSSATFVAPTISNVPRVMSGGVNHICALLRGGNVSCWGTNTAGTMGLGTSGEARSTPVLTPF